MACIGDRSRDIVSSNQRGEFLRHAPDGFKTDTLPRLHYKPKMRCAAEHRRILGVRQRAIPDQVLLGMGRPQPFLGVPVTAIINAALLAVLAGLALALWPRVGVDIGMGDGPSLALVCCVAGYGALLYFDRSGK